MVLNLFNGFILTLKAVFRKIAQYLQLRKTLAETQPKIPDKEEIPQKAFSQTTQEQVPVRIPSQITQEQTREEESKYVEPEEQIRGEKGIRRPRKPYKKKPVTEGREAGLKGLRLHDARHTHASLMLKQGTHPKVVQERLGHASIQITLDTYSHVAPGLQEAATIRLDDILNHKAKNEAVEIHY